MILSKSTFAVCTLLSLFTIQAVAQQVDSLKLAEEWGYAKKYTQALTLLNAYRTTHPTETNALCLYLKILYWNKEDQKAEEGYKNALKTSTAPQIKLDYAQFLVEHNQMNSAYILLESYCQTDPINLEAKYLLAIVYYSQGKLTEAKNLFSQIVLKNPKHPASIYLKELQNFLAPYANTQSGYYTDQQPVNKISSQLEIGVYKTALWSPYVMLQSQQISGLPSMYWIEGGNKSQFYRWKLKTNLFAGIVKLPANKNPQITYGASVTKKIVPLLDASLLIEKRPYLYTLSSLKQTVMQHHALLSLEWGKKHPIYTKEKKSFTSVQNWNISAGAESSLFPDHNSVYGAYGWLMCPPIAIKTVRLRIGYSFSYYNSTVSNYMPTQTVQEVLSTWTPQSGIGGIYNPYFTPLNQQIHSVLASLNCKLSNRFMWTTKGKIGFYASSNIPYLYLQRNSSQQTFIDTGYSQYRYTPFEFNTQLSCTLSPNNSVDFIYTYTRTVLFNSQYIGLSFKHLFSHE